MYERGEISKGTPYEGTKTIVFDLPDNWTERFNEAIEHAVSVESEPIIAAEEAMHRAGTRWGWLVFVVFFFLLLAVF